MFKNIITCGVGHNALTIHAECKRISILRVDIPFDHRSGRNGQVAGVGNGLILFVEIGRLIQSRVKMQ